MEESKDKKNMTWATSNGKINIGSGWTLLALECHLTKECNKCIYFRYCKKNILKGSGKPILKVVVKGLLVKYGKPPKNLIDKLNEWQKE